MVWQIQCYSGQEKTYFLWNKALMFPLPLGTKIHTSWKFSVGGEIMGSWGEPITWTWRPRVAMFPTFWLDSHPVCFWDADHQPFSPHCGHQCVLPYTNLLASGLCWNYSSVLECQCWESRFCAFDFWHMIFVNTIQLWVTYLVPFKIHSSFWMSSPFIKSPLLLYCLKYLLYILITYSVPIKTGSFPLHRDDSFTTLGECNSASTCQKTGFQQSKYIYLGF